MLLYSLVFLLTLWCCTMLRASSLTHGAHSYICMAGLGTKMLLTLWWYTLWYCASHTLCIQLQRLYGWAGHQNAVTALVVYSMILCIPHTVHTATTLVWLGWAPKCCYRFGGVLHDTVHPAHCAYSYNTCKAGLGTKMLLTLSLVVYSMILCIPHTVHTATTLVWLGWAPKCC